MRDLIKLLTVLYLGGIVLAIAFDIRDNWHNSPSVLYTNVVRDLLDAFTWPVTAIRALFSR